MKKLLLYLSYMHLNVSNVSPSRHSSTNTLFYMKEINHLGAYFGYYYWHLDKSKLEVFINTKKNNGKQIR